MPSGWNLFIILVAILTYGSLTIVIVRSALRGARVEPELRGEARRSRAMALDLESLESALRALPHDPGLGAPDAHRAAPPLAYDPAQSSHRLD